MYGHPDAVRQSVRMAIHFFVHFEVFKSLYLSKNLPDKHQTLGFSETDLVQRTQAQVAANTGKRVWVEFAIQLCLS